MFVLNTRPPLPCIDFPPMGYSLQFQLLYRWLRHSYVPSGYIKMIRQYMTIQVKGEYALTFHAPTDTNRVRGLTINDVHLTC